MNLPLPTPSETAQELAEALRELWSHQAPGLGLACVVALLLSSCGPNPPPASPTTPPAATVEKDEGLQRYHIIANSAYKNWKVARQNCADMACKQKADDRYKEILLNAALDEAAEP